MAIAVIIESPGARSRAKYEKSVQLILKGRKKQARGLASERCACAYRGTSAWRLARDRRLAIASGFTMEKTGANPG
jgi:hypothetical protein